MPYIRKTQRENIRQGAPLSEAGELNYAITKLIDEWLNRHGLSYNKSINTILGALEGAKLEFYRRVAAPYEDTKIEENGDVYRGGLGY